MVLSFARALSPVRVILLAFTTAVAVGVGLLMLPIARVGPGGASFLEALFTATSAICVTGLITVDTATYWTHFGQVVIMCLIQIGGFGVMTLATIIGLTVVGRMSLRSRITAAYETHAEGLEDMSRTVWNVFRITALVETSIALVLAARFWLAYDHSLPSAIWHGVFHAISSFNNAGFGLFSDSIMGFVSDPWINIPIMVGIVTGGLGFPVIMQLKRHFRDRLKWTMNTKIVLSMTAFLLLAGTFYITAIEWSNPATLGPLPWYDKIMAGTFQSVQTRTAGFNSIDIGGLYPETLLGMDILMFIGAGPAGTAGGIKVTTVAVLFAIAITELKGETAVNIFGKRLGRTVHRQALTVALLALCLVTSSVVAIIIASGQPLDDVAFEVLSAFGTVGLSTGITAKLGTFSQLVLCMLMYVGRLGPITVATALAMRPRKLLYELPKERPIIG